MTLTVTGLAAGYGDVRVVRDLDLSVAPGTVLALAGRNGMGKTTALNAIMGLNTLHGGRIRMGDTALEAAPAHARIAAGLALVPEGRRVFPTLTVAEHLTVFAAKGTAWPTDRLVDLFPRLGARWRNWGDRLSGGEQQMVAIARALSTDPRLLLLDEATEGLAPPIRAEIWRAIAGLKDAGVGMIAVDRHLMRADTPADAVAVMAKGRVAWHGRPTDLADDPAAAALLGI